MIQESEKNEVIKPIDGTLIRKEYLPFANGKCSATYTREELKKMMEKYSWTAKTLADNDKHDGIDGTK